MSENNELPKRAENEEHSYHKCCVKFEYVYCITSSILNGVKIGKWSNSIEKLRKRYNTYYGQDINIFYVRTLESNKIEKECHNHFEKYRISNELFDVSHVLEYQQYLSDHNDTNIKQESTTEMHNTNHNTEMMCPFCNKELCRTDRIRYHLEHDVCGYTQNSKELSIVTDIINAPISKLAKISISYIRKLEEFTRRQNVNENELYFKLLHIKSIQSELDCAKTEIMMLKQMLHMKTPNNDTTSVSVNSIN